MVSPRRFPDSVARLLVVFASLAGGAVLFRSFVVPASLKEPGHHRRSTMEREAARPVLYAGSEVCGDCHDDVVSLKASGYHRGLACESCHGPARAHVDDPGSVTPPAPRTRAFCPVCHAYDPARPTGFPQIQPVLHNPRKPCVGCHDPHDPRPPELPRECGACHAAIARTKAVSPHALLPCTTCHDVPVEHRLAPRVAKATKPTEKAFCGKCHGQGSPVVEAPKVDAATHGGKYLCWDCHYPHLPEAHPWTAESS